MNCIEIINTAIEKSRRNESILIEDILQIPGMSNNKVRHLLSNIVQDGDNYLEIGVHKGSTFVSSCYGKKLNKNIAIDNWSEFGYSYDDFIDNCNKYLGYIPTMITNDSFSFDPVEKNISNINVYFYDGGHDELSQYKALTNYYNILTDEFIFIVDDYKHDKVKRGTQNAIIDLNLDIIYDVYLDGSHQLDEYWDGIYIACLRKNIKLDYKINSYSTHQPVLIEVINKTTGNILECGCGDSSTKLIKSLILNTNRKLISLESDKNWLDKFSNLNDKNLSIFYVDASNDDIDSTGQIWQDFFKNNDSIKNNFFDVIFVDQSPWIARTYTLEYFKDKAKFIIIHDADYFPIYGKWGKIINNEYDFSDVCNNYKFFPTIPPTLLLSNTLTKEEFENYNIDISKY